MTEEFYNNILLQVKKSKKIDIAMSYQDYIEYVNIIREKVNYNENLYNNNKELFWLSEIAILTWGMFAFSTSNPLKNEDKEHIGIIFHSLSTQISNNMLTALILCNNSLDYQSGIIMRSTCELCFTLLVLLLNKSKRKKYFDSARLNNEVKIWNEEFKFKDLNEELKKFEDFISKNDTFLSKKLGKFRKKLYQYYSNYIHNSFFNCFFNSYTFSEDVEQPMIFNLWGEEASRTERLLVPLCQLNLFTCLDLFNYIVKNIEIKKYVENDELCQKFWNNAGYFFLIFEEYCIDKIATD